MAISLTKNLSALLLLVSFTAATPSYAETILLVGDSHTCFGGFGLQLIKKLEKGGANQVDLYCAGGSPIDYWMKERNPGQGYHSPMTGGECFHIASSSGVTNIQLNKNLCKEATGGPGWIPMLPALLKLKKYSRVVIAHGSNSLGEKVATPSFAAAASAVAAVGAQCIWVGPPSLAPKPGSICTTATRFMTPGTSFRGNLPYLVASIKAKVGGSCLFIDSSDPLKVPEPPVSAPDCIHRYGQPAIDWANYVFGQMGI